MFFKLALLISVELFVLISAVFLLVYIIKQQVSKWFAYCSTVIVLSILVMMICTIFGAMCARHFNYNRIRNEYRYKENKCNEGEMAPYCSHGTIHESECSEGMKECEMNDKCGSKEEKVIRKEVIISDNDSLPKKTMIIKKK